MTDPILTSTRAALHFDLAQAMAWVRATHGLSSVRQMAQMARLIVGARFQPKDYYMYGLYDPRLTASERAAYLSIPRSNALNLRLSPVQALRHTALLDDKLMAGFVMERLGLPVPRLIGHAAAVVRVPGTLCNAAEIAAFLRREGVLPSFGKPVHSTIGIGGASFIRLADGGEKVVLGDGRAVPVTALAEEILRVYPEGYLLQELLENGPEMAALAGRVLVILRIVTVQGAAGPEVLYSLLRFPGAGAMVDSTTGGRMLLGLLDADTGRIVRVQDMYRMGHHAVDAHPETGVPFAGFLPPMLEAAAQLVCAGHAAFAEHGVLGWDVGLTARGPILIEANSNPQHYLYQRAANRGVMNPDLAPRIEAALRFAAGRVEAARLRDARGV